VGCTPSLEVPEQLEEGDHTDDSREVSHSSHGSTECVGVRVELKVSDTQKSLVHELTHGPRKREIKKSKVNMAMFQTIGPRAMMAIRSNPGSTTPPTAKDLTNK
jgi:hypothetical protein